MFSNVRVTFGQVLENIRKSSESGRKSSENSRKRRHQCVYIIKRTLHVRSRIWILCSCHSNIKFVSPRHRVISSIFYRPRYRTYRETTQKRGRCGSESSQRWTVQGTERRVFQRSNLDVHFTTSKHCAVIGSIYGGGTLWNGVRVYEQWGFKSIFEERFARGNVTGLR